MAAKKKASPQEIVPVPAPEGTSIGEQVALYDRVVTILEQARASVVRAVNTHMVLAYWMIGREIVQALQQGEKRAAYGEAVLATLSRQLRSRFGQGFSETNLKHFRTFYLVYQIRHPAGDQLASVNGTTTVDRPKMGTKARPPASSSTPAGQPIIGFSPQLSWSHYQALMRVPNANARDFYEREAIIGGWDKRTLERQIHTSYYERTLKSHSPLQMLDNGRQTLQSTEPAVETLKSPYVLEFLGLPELARLRESQLEAAILTYLQAFLLELGNGFAFVARQKRLRFDEDDRYVDLVFYHCKLRFYLLIDLKVNALTHGDVGQMDGYVRMFDDLVASEDDNPTIGLILCAEKSDTIVRYSVLNDRRQIFASEYMLYLPTEEELRREIERERRLIEDSQRAMLSSGPGPSEEDSL